MDSVKENDMKNCTYYFFDDMIDTKNLDPNKIKIHEKPHKKYSYLSHWIPWTKILTM